MSGPPAYQAYHDQTGGYPNVSPSAPPQHAVYAAPGPGSPIVAQAVPVQNYQMPVAYAQQAVLQPGAPQPHLPVAHATYAQPAAGQAVAVPVQGGMVVNQTYRPQAVAASRAILNHELFGCDKDIGTCCVAWCCPCIVYGQNKEMAGQDFASNCMIHCFMTYCFGSIGGALVACQPRMQLMKTTGVQTDECNSFCVHCCCAACALTQEKRALEILTGRVAAPGQGAPAQDDMER